MKKILLLIILILSTAIQAADTELQDMVEMTAIVAADALYVVDDPLGAPASRFITALNLFDMIDTFAELQAITADETLVSEEGTPTLDALWTFDLGLTITTGDPLTFGVNRIDNGADLLDGEMIGADTIDDDSIDWADCTLADFDFETAWKMFHSDAAGDVIEITLGANGTFLESNGAAANPAFRALVDNDVPDNITIDLATLATTVTMGDDDAANDNQDIIFTTDAAGPVNLEADIGDFYYNPSTGTVTATEFAGGGAGVTGVDAATGDSATAFFDAGTIEHEWGGLQANLAAYTGLIGITGADTTVEVDTSAEMLTAITDETGTGKLTFATAPVFVTSVQLTGADANPAAAAGTIAYDNTIAVMSGGGIRWYDNDSVRLIVDLETDPSVDDHVVTYDAAADGFYMSAAGTGNMNTATYDAGVSGGVDQITTVDSTYASDYVLLTGTAVGTDAPKTDAGLTYDATSGTLSSTILTEGGLAVYNSGETPSGSLGGTYANITIDDLFILLGGDVATAGDYDFGGANVDLELPQTSPAVPDVDGQVEVDFTDGKVVIQHSSGHAELGASTDVVVGTLIKSWSGTIFEPDGVNDVLTVKAINSIEFPHGVVITAVYLGVSSDDGYVLTVQNFDDFDTISAGNPTIDTVTYPADATGEIIDSTPTFATIAAGQIIMVSIPATDVDWIHFEIYYYEPAA